MNNQTTDAD